MQLFFKLENVSESLQKETTTSSDVQLFFNTVWKHYSDYKER